MIYSLLLWMATSAFTQTIRPQIKIDTSTSVFHGDTLVDPYHWLADRNNPEVLNLLFAENQYLNQHLSETEWFQTKLIEEFKSRIVYRNKVDLGIFGDHRYYVVREKNENHPKFYRQKSGDEAPELILDVKEIDPGNPFIHISDVKPSPDGDVLAFGVDFLGNEAISIKFKDLKTGQNLEDIIPMASGFSWSEDGRQVIYVRRDSLFRPRSIYIHKLGTDIEQDVLVYQSTDPNSFIKLQTSTSGRFHFIYDYTMDGIQSWYLTINGKERLFKSLASKDSERIVADHFYHDKDSHDDSLFIYTTKGNEYGRIVRVSTENPNINSASYLAIEGSPDERIGVDFSDDHFASFTMTADYIVLSLEDRGNVKYLAVNKLTGDRFNIIPPDSIYTSYPIKVDDYWDNKFRFYHSSLTNPGAVYEVDLATRTRRIIRKHAVKNYNPEDFTAYRIYAKASDGSTIPMSIVHKKGLVLDGNNPVIIDGYGASGTNPDMGFKGPMMVSLLERGIVYVKTHIRGDGGFGRQWIEDGRRLKKMNAYTDFISCVEHLIAEGYSNPDKILARGGSAGGILMGVVANLRPDLFTALNIQVPVIDVVHFMDNDSLFVVPYLYAELGDPKIEKEYRYIKSYSPYQNIKAQEYPDMLLYCVYNDLRAGYWEAAKYVAKVRSMKTDTNRILLQTDFNASHDRLGGTEKQLKQSAMEFAWYFQQLGIASDYVKLRGKVSDGKDPLPFTHIRLAGSLEGTIANDSGYFELDVRKRDVELVFSQVGYKTKEVKVGSAQMGNFLDVKMSNESRMLKEVVVTASYADPALEIMKKALNRKKDYQNEMNGFSAKAYIRSRQYLEQLPEKMPLLIGKNAFPEKGIFELSETMSEIHYQRRPHKYKEKVLSSVNKVRSETRPFSWHRASYMGVDMYEKFVRLGGQRTMVSPLADNAFFFYNFTYQGSKEEEGHLIHKIELQAKRTSDPAFNGFVYVVDSTWDVSAVDLVAQPAGLRFLTGASISQKFLPVDSGFWLPVSQNKKLKARVLGVELISDDDILYSDYYVNPTFSKKFFQTSAFEIALDANRKDSIYWKEQRPLVITDHEASFYKDSLEMEGSENARRNRFTFDNAFGGFKTKGTDAKKAYIRVHGLLQAINFNSVEGWNIDFAWSYKTPATNVKKDFTFSGNLRYGFSNSRFNAKAGVQKDLDKTRFQWINIEGGKYVFQFNERNPITPLVNSLYTLFLRENYLKIYEKVYGRVIYHQELTNGLYAYTSFQVEERMPLINTSNYSFRGSEGFTSNDPQDALNTTASFTTHQAAIFQIGAKFNFIQKYELVGGRKVVRGSDTPTLGFVYKKALEGISAQAVGYDKVDVFVLGKKDVGLVGRSHYFLNGGKFYNTKKLEFMDFQHFNGNQTDVILNQPSVATDFYTTRSFRLLDYYSESTSKEYIELHYQHNFNGFILNKIPVVRKAKLKSVVGYSFLRNDQGNYTEAFLGVQKTIFQSVTLGLEVIRNNHSQTGVKVLIKG